MNAANILGGGGGVHVHILRYPKPMLVAGQPPLRRGILSQWNEGWGESSLEDDAFLLANFYKGP